MNEINKPVSPKRWRKSISLPDGTEKSVCVKEIENGFLVEMYKSWTDKNGCPLFMSVTSVYHIPR